MKGAAQSAIAPHNAGDSVTFTPNVVLFGNVFLRLRHLTARQTSTTLFRAQFYTGFVKLFKLNLSAKELDRTKDWDDLSLACVFSPAETTALMEDPYEGLIMKESSALWSEVLKRKEGRMASMQPATDAFVVGHSRSAKRLSAETRKSLDSENHDYVDEISKLENELKQLGTDAHKADEAAEETLPLVEGVDIDSILQNYKEEMGENVEEFDLKDFEDVLKEKPEGEVKAEAVEAKGASESAQVAGDAEPAQVAGDAEPAKAAETKEGKNTAEAEKRDEEKMITEKAGEGKGEEKEEGSESKEETEKASEA